MSADAASITPLGAMAKGAYSFVREQLDTVKALVTLRGEHWRSMGIKEDERW